MRHCPDFDGPDFDGPDFDGPDFDGPDFDREPSKVMTIMSKMKSIKRFSVRDVAASSHYGIMITTQIDATFVRINRNHLEPSQPSIFF